MKLIRVLVPPKGWSVQGHTYYTADNERFQIVRIYNSLFGPTWQAEALDGSAPFDGTRYFEANTLADCRTEIEIVVENVT